MFLPQIVNSISFICSYFLSEDVTKKGKNKHAFTTVSQQQQGETRRVKIQLKTHTFIKETKNPRHCKHSSSSFSLSLQSFLFECVRFLNSVLDLFTNLSEECVFSYLVWSSLFPLSPSDREREKKSHTCAVKLDMGSLWRSQTFLV